jgi:O-antigen/teichoic acid export membrane protein
MFNRLKRSTLANAIGIYGLGNIFGAAVPFLLLPFLTRTLTQEDYGLVAMFSVLTAFAYPFCALSINEFLQVRYFKTNSEQFHQMKQVAVKICLYSSLIVGGIFLVLSGPISELSEFPRLWLGFVVLTAAARAICELILSIWQVENQPFKFIFLQAGQTLFNLSVTLLLVAAIPLAWKGRVLAQGGAAFLGCSVALYYLYKFVKKKDVEEEERSENSIENRMLSYGLPLIPHSTSTVVMDMTDRIILTHLLGLAVTGVYAVGFQISLIISIIGFSLHKGWTPWLYSCLKLNSLKDRSRIRTGIVAYVAIMILAVAGLTVCSNAFLPFFLGQEFADATKYILWISIGFGLNSICSAIISIALYKDQVRQLSTVSLLVALIHVLQTFWLIDEFGSIGAAYSISAAYALKLVGASIVVLRSGGLTIMPSDH